MKTPRTTSARPRRAAGKTASGPGVIPRLDPPIRVMISSRNKDEIPDGQGGMVPLYEVRTRLKAELNAMTLCGHPLLETWINEDAGAEPGDDAIWEICREQMERSQIIIALINGEAGWCRESGLGICHEEIKYAFDHFPARLYLLRIGETPAKSPENDAFATFLKSLKRWEEPARDAEELIVEVKRAVAKAVCKLTIAGSRVRKGKYYFGSPLDWSRLGYKERKVQIERAAAAYLQRSRAHPLTGAGVAEGSPSLEWEVGGARILLRVHGVPAGFGLAEAREMVGRPQLNDHLTDAATSDGRLLGPVHLIACHQTCPESRIYSFLGHPDVYIVHTPFGFFAVDRTSFVQAFFLVDCRDQDSTVMGLERLFEWIAEAGEEKAIVDRARSRQRILAAIRSEVDTLAGIRPAGSGPRGTGTPPPVALEFGELPA